MDEDSTTAAEGPALFAGAAEVAHGGRVGVDGGEGREVLFAPGTEPQARALQRHGLGHGVMFAPVPQGDKRMAAALTFRHAWSPRGAGEGWRRAHAGEPETEVVRCRPFPTGYGGAADGMASNQGYAAEAEALVRQYEALRFEDVQGWLLPLLPLLPPAPARVLEVGAGTGRDAAGFAAMGHAALAVEPTAGLRTRAMALHPSPRIEWLDDGLPDLARVLARGEAFDAATLAAVWMHLDAGERRRAMPNLARLVRPGGLVAMTLRHGPVPLGRRMFEVAGEETVRLAAAHGLVPVIHEEGGADVQRRPGVSWTRLALRRAVPAA